MVNEHLLLFHSEAQELNMFISDLIHFDAKQ